MAIFQETLDAVRAVNLDGRDPKYGGESDMTARIVGEFSGGKTRFLRALLGDDVPPELQPVSSMEVQTVLPLEVAHGEGPKLELIRRKSDFAKPEIIREFAVFPRREELAEDRDADLRLRLTINEPRLLIEEEDRGETVQKALRIIDQPGWNSEDDARGFEALGLSDQWDNYALIYVCKLIRLDSAVNERNLRIFLDALSNDLLLDREPFPLFLVITECPPEKRQESEQKLMGRVREALGEKIKKFDLRVVALDLAAISPGELAAVRDLFWDAMLQEKTKAETEWPEDWRLAPWLASSLQWLERLRALAAGLKPRDKYMGGREMLYFKGLPENDLRAKALRDWQKLLGAACDRASIAALEPPDLPAAHPLRPWLDAYWLPRLREARDAQIAYLDAMSRALGEELYPQVPSLEKWLDARLGDVWQKAVRPFPEAFAKMLATLEKEFSQAESAPASDLPIARALLALSLLEARFTDNTRSA